MKKYILSLVVLCLTLANAMAVAGDTLNQIDAAGKRQGYWKISAADKKVSGFPTPGSTVEEGRYVNSMKTGIWIEYYPTGKKKSELTFVNNRPNGPAKMYHENGNLSERRYLGWNTLDRSL